MELSGAAAHEEGAVVNPSWPDIPFKAWQQTCSALQLYCQIVGKYRLARTAWVNHSWHVTFEAPAIEISRV
jgi:hypothetical protein